MGLDLGFLGDIYNAALGGGPKISLNLGKKGSSDTPADTDTHEQGGDDQGISQSGSNKNEQKNSAASDQRDEISGDAGGAEVDAGRNASTTTISPTVTSTPKVTVEGQSQASSQLNASAALQGQEHQQVQAHNEVQAAQQNIAVPVTVDMSKQATANTETSPYIAVAAVGALALALILSRRRNSAASRTTRGGGRRARRRQFVRCHRDPPRDKGGGQQQ